MHNYARRIYCFALSFLMILFLTACGQANPSPEVQLVQNSKSAYGTVYNALVDLGANSTIQSMPTFKGAADQYFSDSVWSSLKDNNGQLFVQLKGVVNYKGVKTPMTIQWRINGDPSTNSAYPVYHGFAMFGKVEPQPAYNIFILDLLYEMNILSKEEVAFMASYMAFDYIFSK